MVLIMLSSIPSSTAVNDNVTECLSCQNIPATCTFGTEEQIGMINTIINCTVDVTSCSQETCRSNGRRHVCSQDFTGVLSRNTLFSSFCFEIFRPDPCSKEEECMFNKNFGGMLDCCCFQNNCLTEGLDIVEIQPPPDSEFNVAMPTSPPIKIRSPVAGSFFFLADLAFTRYYESS